MGTMTFTRIYPEAIEPMRADKAALGYMPTSAFQYCEAMRVASAHGWYVFPPLDIHLRWNGADVFHWEDGAWRPLTFVQLPGLGELWNDRCPEGYEDLAPPYLRALPAPGAVQVWSGWLMEAAEDWSALVRPLVNVHRSALFHCFEAVVEADRFRPCPLFVNLQLRSTDTEIVLPRLDPLFQVQAIQRGSFEQSHTIKDGLSIAGMSIEDWASYRRTIRTSGVDETHRLGDYAAEVRKRAKATHSGRCPVHSQ